MSLRRLQPLQMRINRELTACITVTTADKAKLMNRFRSTQTCGLPHLIKHKGRNLREEACEVMPINDDHEQNSINRSSDVSVMTNVGSSSFTHYGFSEQIQEAEDKARYCYWDKQKPQSCCWCQQNVSKHYCRHCTRSTDSIVVGIVAMFPERRHR